MKTLSREQMKNVMGGKGTLQRWTCSGEGFGSETYSVNSHDEAQQMAVISIIAGTADGSCPATVGPITCFQSYWV